jgi:hypothetical protein
MKGIWQNTLCILAALWLCISPFALHLKLDTVVISDTDIVGFFIGILSIIAIATHHVWEEWTKVILGIWLLASPWFLGIGHKFLAAGDIITVSMVVLILSLWSLVSRSFASHSTAQPRTFPPTATELLSDTMNLKRRNTHVANPR